MSSDVYKDMVQDKYLEDLRKGICKVTFTKKDGTERVMRCTLDLGQVPAEHMPKSDGNTVTEESKGPLETVRVFDIEKEGWRSFRLDSVKMFVPSAAMV